jgi:aklavinone 12-hydroxylase
MQDGYDLAWKLALVLQGQADAGLLATYEEERRHAAQLTVALQTANYAARIRPDRQQELRTGVRPEEDYLAIAAGCRYRSAAICPDGPDDGARAESPLHPTGTPGTRAAHVVLEHRGARISSIDLIGRDFVLICGPEGAAWAQAATALRYSQGLPLSIYRIGADLLDVEGTWAQRLGVSASGAVLLRPDGYIAWRSSTLQRAPGEALRGALARALCRPGQWAGFGASGQAA